MATRSLWSCSKVVSRITSLQVKAAQFSRICRPRCLRTSVRQFHSFNSYIFLLTTVPSGSQNFKSCFVQPSSLTKRTLVIRSKKGKRKSVKAVLKRFKLTGSGKVKYWRPGRNRRQMRKNVRARKAIKRPAYCNKQQTKLIKKMMGL